jgi:signal transduction histidine kinase/CheY-like chemotaxis protein/PAS domain-containing protein
MSSALKRTFLFLIPILIAVAGCAQPVTPGATASTDRGVLDLRGRDFSRHGSISLNGLWDVYPGQLLSPGDTGNTDHASGLPLAQEPVNRMYRSMAGNAGGFSTYKLTVILDRPGDVLSLKISNIYRAYRVWIDDRPVWQSGTVGTSALTALPGRESRVISFRPESSAFTITIQSSSFHHRFGGLHGDIFLGSASTIQSSRDRMLALDLFIFGGLIIMSVYHFGLFATRRKDRSLLYFALLCLLLSIRALLSGEHFFGDIFPHSGWELRYRLEYLTAYLSVPALILFYTSMYPCDRASKYCAFVQYAGFVFPLAAMLTPVKIINHTLLPFSAYAVTVFLMIIVLLIGEMRERREGASLFLAGFLVLLLAGCNDVLTSLDIIRSMYLSQIGFLLFVLPQTVALARRIAHIDMTNDLREKELLDADSARLREMMGRKTAEDDIRNLQRRFEFILGSTRTGLVIKDSDHNIRYIDPETEKKYGPPGGVKCYRYFLQRDEPCPDCGMRKAFSRSTTVITEAVMPLEGNRPVQLIFIPYQDDSGEWLVAQVNVDITERKKVENELKLYHDQLEDIIRWRTSELTAANARLQEEIRERKRAEEQLLLDESRLQALIDLNQLVDSSVRDITDFALAQAVRLTGSASGYLAFVNRDETAITMHSWSNSGLLEFFSGGKSAPIRIEESGLVGEAVRRRSPVIDNSCIAGANEVRCIRNFNIELKRYLNVPVFDGRKIVALAGVANKECDYDDSDVRQLTLLMQGMYRLLQRRRGEEEVLRARKLESLGTLAGGIAHDFNNLLTVVYGNISLARMTEQGHSGNVALLSEAEQAVVRAKGLTQKLLTFSMGGAPVKSAASIGALLRDTACFLLSGSPSKCVFSIDDGLWSAEIDEDQIRQVIHNIVINARDAMPEGGALFIDAKNIVLSDHGIHGMKAGDYLKISFRDEGCGIPPDNLGRIFDPYFSTKEHGSGLGLAVCYSIVKNHGGHISARSEAGQWSSFTVYLPALRGTDVQAEKSAGDMNNPGGKILVMDDDPMVLKITALTLESLGYSCDCARDGGEAVEMYNRAGKSKEPYSALIMDLTVPGGMSATTAIQKILSTDPNARGILSSGYSNSPVISRHRDHGFRAVLIKPYRRDELQEVLARVLAMP